MNSNYWAVICVVGGLGSVFCFGLTLYKLVLEKSISKEDKKKKKSKGKDVEEKNIKRLVAGTCFCVIVFVVGLVGGEQPKKLVRVDAVHNLPQGESAVRYAHPFIRNPRLRVRVVGSDSVVAVEQETSSFFVVSSSKSCVIEYTVEGYLSPNPED